jgi:AraC-like DNA-binding protein
MPGGGSSIFTDASRYEAGLGGMLDLLVLRPRQFQARLTWVELPHLRLLHAQEASARIAYTRLPPELAFVTFPTQRDALLICSGVELQFGELMFHSRGEHLHQRTTGGACWGAISLSPEPLARFAHALADCNLVTPDVSQVMRPKPADRQRLLRLHAEAARIAERDLRHIAHREVAHALDQELMLALVRGLTGGSALTAGETIRRRSKISVGLEALFAVHPDRPLCLREISRAIGVSQQALRTDCTRLLGMSVERYQRLRRLRSAHRELARVSAAANGDLIVQRYGFADIHQFATEYCKAYGAVPTVTGRN